MANIKSQVKRNRQNITRRDRNLALRTELKTRARSALAAAEAGDSAQAADALQVAQRKLDVAVSKGIIHANTAARRKSRLTRRVNELLAQ